MWGATPRSAVGETRLSPGALRALTRTLRVVALASCATGALLQGRAQADSLNIPLQLVPVTTGGETYYRLGINVGLGSSAPKPYEFDTGSAPFNAGYSAQWWPTSSHAAREDARILLWQRTRL